MVINTYNVHNYVPCATSWPLQESPASDAEEAAAKGGLKATAKILYKDFPPFSAEDYSQIILRIPPAPKKSDK
jgi:hypothetical protein